VYPEIEEQLLKVQLAHPKGKEDIKRENNKKWR